MTAAATPYNDVWKGHFLFLISKFARAFTTYTHFVFDHYQIGTQ